MSEQLKTCRVVQQALKTNPQTSTSNLFFDIDLFRRHLSSLKNAFPGNVPVTHCMAVKTFPLPAVLEIARGCGFGAEAASMEEVMLAQNAGIPASKIVWDSPCKTESEIEIGLKHGVNMNADNFQELQIYDDWIKKGVLSCDKKSQRHNKSPPPSQQSHQHFLGLRVNPCIGAGSIESMSTATLSSKFGIPLAMYESEIVEAYRKYDWLNTMHVHIGSQGCDYMQIANGVAVILKFCDKINESLGYQKITCIDIGGGLPVDYSSDDVDKHLESFGLYSTELGNVAPDLFSGKYHVITEMGRSLTAKCGWTLSKVEYTKVVGDRTIVTQHIGANILLRTCYQPDTWLMRMYFCDKHGQVKQSNEETDITCDVVGPLCFSGDVIAHERKFPKVERGDWLVVLDAGSNTIGLWSKHCSRSCPPVIGYQKNGDGFKFTTLKEKETIENNLKFWK